jgi:hypothetical protein
MNWLVAAILTLPVLLFWVAASLDDEGSDYAGFWYGACAGTLGFLLWRILQNMGVFGG